MNDWIVYFNSLGESWLHAMVRAGWQGGLALLLAFTVSRFVPGLSARVKCWIWRLAYAKLLIAFVWAQPIELPLLAPAAATPPEVPLPVTMTSERGELLGPTISSRVSPSPPACLMALWLIGFAAGAALIGRDLVRLQRLKRRCVAANSVLEDCAIDLAQRLRLVGTPRLLICDGVSTPFLFGMWRPHIVVPASYANNPDAKAVRLMIGHEMAHVKRRDLWWAWLFSVSEAVFFFHPLIWLARRESRLVQEMACDQLALRATSAETADYGKMLLSIVSHGTGSSRLTSVSVGIFETKQSLERRIEHMKTTRPNRAWAIASALTICVAVALTIPWRVVAQKGPDALPETRTEEATPAEVELLRKEIDLARRHANSERQRLEAGRGMPQALLERQRELFLLQQDLARKEGDLAAQRQVLEDALKQMKELWREQKKRVDLGTLPPGDELGFEREVVRLERELHALNRSPASQTNAVGAARGAGSRPIQIFPISSPVAGVVTEVLVRPGAKVKKADVLIRFDDREAKVKLDAALSQVAAAEAALKLQEIEVEDAQARYRRLKELASDRRAEEPLEASGPRGAEARLAKSVADLKFAQAQSNLARLAVESLAVRAPRDGTVSSLRVTEGEYVPAGGRPLVVLEE